MKERPILFSGPMARAILAGEKSQTRRLIKLHPAWGFEFHLAQKAPQLCPFGQPGDRLWVRERWSPYSLQSGRKYSVFPDGAHKYQDGEYIPGLKRYSPGAFDLIKWKPSIHMPRWASRINLEVTWARAARLQEITAAEILEEGVRVPAAPVIGPYCAHDPEDLRFQFSNLWDDINGPGAWASNPWVWAIGFRRIP